MKDGGAFFFVSGQPLVTFLRERWNGADVPPSKGRDLETFHKSPASIMIGCAL